MIVLAWQLSAGPCVVRCNDGIPVNRILATFRSGTHSQHPHSWGTQHWHELLDSISCLSARRFSSISQLASCLRIALAESVPSNKIASKSLTGVTHCLFMIYSKPIKSFGSLCDFTTIQDQNLPLENSGKQWLVGCSSDHRGATVYSDDHLFMLIECK